MTKKKKIILVVAMVAVLAIAAYVNIWLINSQNQPDNPEDPVVTTGSFFVTSRSDRQNTRNYEIGLLDEILALEGEEFAQAKADALQQKLKLVEITDTELLLETMLKAQGFTDAFVSIGTTSSNINVIVDVDELTKEDNAKIYNVIISEVATSPDYIKILAV